MVDLVSALAGGFIGGILGVLASFASSFYGPKKLEEWREQQAEERIHAPRKRLLENMLEDPNRKMRSIETLCRASGTSPEECRRLLIEIGARGIRLTGNREGWVLLKYKPLEQMDDDEEVGG